MYQSLETVKKYTVRLMHWLSIFYMLGQNSFADIELIVHYIRYTSWLAREPM